MECTFCKIYNNKQDIIFENKYFWAQFDSFPVSPGHAEIMPKRHISSLFDLTDKEWNHLKPAIFQVTKIIKSTDLKIIYDEFILNPTNDNSKWLCKQMLNSSHLHDKTDDYNIGVNEGELAGRTINHLHIHIIPRYPGDVIDQTGGVRHVIPKYANYKNLNILN